MAFALIASTLALVSSGRAAKIYPSAGSTSATFLKLEVGARAVAMGGAFTGVGGDPYAIYWNPAGLSALEGEKNASLFHNEYFQGLGQEFLLYTASATGGKFLAVPAPKAGVWGLGLNYFYVPKDMERRSGLNESDPENPISPVEGKFGASDMAFSAAYASRFGGGLSLGAALKVIRQSIDDTHGSSLAADLGLMRDFTWHGQALTGGFTVQNIGPGIKMLKKRYGLPLVARAGISTRLRDSAALLSADIEKYVDDYPSLAVGAEFPLTSRLVLRSGYRYRLYGNDQGGWSGFSAGAGVLFERVTFDYAFTPFGDLGNAHRFSLSLKFGQAPAVKAPPVTEAPMQGGAAAVYAVTRRALAMSPRGIKYELTADSAVSRLYSFSFRTLLRGSAPGALSMIEGDFPPGLGGGLPAGLKPLRAWQTTGFSGGVQGAVLLKFKLKIAEAGKERTVFLYGDGTEWKSTVVVFEREDGEFYYFSEEAPPSGYYAVAVKD